MNYQLNNDVLEIISPTCRTVADARLMSNKEWVDFRNNMETGGIGGSEAAGCFVPALSQYTSRMIVVMTKLGLMPPVQDNDAMKHGRRMEPVLRREFPELYRDVTGETIQVFASPYVYKSIERPYMIANIDGVVIMSDGRIGGLEIKTADSHDGWMNDEVPDSYYAQVQHYMYVLGLSFFFVAVLIRRTYEYRLVPRNEKFIEAMLKAEDATFEYISRGEIPAPSGIDAEDTALLAKYPNERDMVVDLKDMALMRDEYRTLLAKESELKTRKKEISQLVKARMGEAKYGNFGNGKAVWSRFDCDRFDKEALQKQEPAIYGRYATVERSDRLLIK